jgi:hypothetical protein
MANFVTIETTSAAAPRAGTSAANPTVASRSRMNVSI